MNSHIAAMANIIKNDILATTMNFHAREDLISSRLVMRMFKVAYELSQSFPFRFPIPRSKIVAIIPEMHHAAMAHATIVSAISFLMNQSVVLMHPTVLVESPPIPPPMPLGERPPITPRSRLNPLSLL